MLVYYFQSLTHNILQMLTSVMKRMSVMLMLSVRTQMVVTCVPVNQDFLEMDTTVQVQILKKANKQLPYTVYITIDINECDNVTCGENAECVNTEGNYSCQCDPGLTGDGYNCTGLLHMYIQHRLVCIDVYFRFVCRF